MGAPLRLLLLLPLLIVPALALLWLFALPDVSRLKQRPPETTAYIELRRRQAKLQKKPFEPRRTWVGWDSIAEPLRDAVVTAEDDMFWRHKGVDWDALREAWRRDVKEKRLAAGASTISMQLARNLYLSPRKSVLRKAKEILIARKLEKELGKRRILELYLNVVEWGDGIFGCEAAARHYFAKSCAELTPDEAVAMAVVLPNPRRWDPAKAGPYVQRNSRRIIGRMIAAGLRDAPPSEELPGGGVELSSAAAGSEGLDPGDAVDGLGGERPGQEAGDVRVEPALPGEARDQAQRDR